METGKEPVPGDKVRFKIAIRDAQTHTLMLFSEQTYREIDIQKILS